jgi:hypothetical protein
MSKVTVSFEFDSLEDAFSALMSAPVPAPSPVLQVLTPATQGARAPQEPSTEKSEVEKKVRKARSDAGQPRGPYKKTAAEEAADSAKIPVQETTIAAEGQSAPPAAPEPTIEDVRAAMGVLNKKHGIEANMKQLAVFGVSKASELPKAKYAEFIAAVKKAAGVA